jgi:hypothetical protein
MCREEALVLQETILPLCHALDIGVYGVVKETLGQPEFSEKYWKAPLFLDEKRSFYAALNGGTEKKAGLMSLFSSDVRKNYARAKNKAEGNMRGEGTILGGLLIVSKEKGVVYSYAEKTFGDHAPIQEVATALQSLRPDKPVQWNPNGSVKPSIVCQNDICFKP